MVPNPHDGKVDREKIVNYLLADSHVDGAPKAAYFARYGFDLEQWDIMRLALVEHVI
jgi:hypothetical protein